MHKKNFIMKDKSGIFNADFLNVIFIQFNSVEKNGMKILLQAMLH